jgi:hypothetical protein
VPLGSRMRRPFLRLGPSLPVPLPPMANAASGARARPTRIEGCNGRVLHALDEHGTGHRRIVSSNSKRPEKIDGKERRRTSNYAPWWCEVGGPLPMMALRKHIPSQAAVPFDSLLR